MDENNERVKHQNGCRNFDGCWVEAPGISVTFDRERDFRPDRIYIVGLRE